MLVILVNGWPYRFQLSVQASITSMTKSALFIKDFAISEIRADRLFMVASTFLQETPISDSYIWSKLMAAESELQHTLRVKFQPTQYFSYAPSQTEIAALNGMPWEQEPGYDYDPEMFTGDRWGFMVTRQKPIISVQLMQFCYPSILQSIFTVPLDWLRIDNKYAQIRLVPTSYAATTLMNGFLLQLVGGGRQVPNILQVNYTAGLQNVASTYPELIDVVKKIAVLKIIEDSFSPQSGSISADGLSQSMSADMSKYEDSIDRIINGSGGGNGGLMTAIHGIRLGVV